MNDVRPSTPGGHSIYCEDVRREHDGKFSLMGMFPGAVSVPSFPCAIAKLNAIVTYIERPGESDLPVTLRIFGPDNPDVPLFEGSIPIAEARVAAMPKLDETYDPIVSVTAVVGFAPLLLAKPGLIRCRAFRGDDVIRLGTLLITTSEAASAAGTDEVVSA